MCGNSICERLSIIFNVCLKEWKFLLTGEILMLYLFTRKEINSVLKIIDLFPICSKIFERLIYNELIAFFTDIELVSLKESGFRSGNSCVDQLLAITHEIHESFDDGFEVREVFLHITKIFDKVWHKSLSVNGTSENLSKLFY